MQISLKGDLMSKLNILNIAEVGMIKCIRIEVKSGYNKRLSKN